jgi:prepilin-type N-terminal cleavage/methylation domain-containing protein
MRKQKGFSLIELLIVVAIILIIAAIAIPNLLRARMAANESSAVASIRTINTGMITYNSAYPTVGYATTLAALGGVAPCSKLNHVVLDRQCSECRHQKRLHVSRDWRRRSSDWYLLRGGGSGYFESDWYPQLLLV